MKVTTTAYREGGKRKLFILPGLIFWLFLYLTAVSRTYTFFIRQGEAPDLAYIFIRAFLIWGIPVLFIPVFLWFAQRFPINDAPRYKSYKNSAIHLVLGLLVVPVHAVLFRAIMLTGYWMMTNESIEWSWSYFMDPVLTITTWLIVIGPLTYWVIIGAYHFKMYDDRLHERQLRNLKLESELSSIRLQVLKIQLHPHFLFNTLHNINSLIYEDAEKAKQMLSLLKNFLRLSLTKMDQQIIPLRDELEFTEIYLDIIQTRFSDRLDIEKNVDPYVLGIPVPSLVLQPLVENAVRHGISKKIRAGVIRITANQKGDRLQLIIEDNGPGLKKGKCKNGIGFQNITQRLDQLYSFYRFDLEHSELGGLKIVIELPVEPEEESLLINP